MTATARPRRSLLFMPGTNARAIAKARSLDVDGVILDLEDAVAADKKEEARAAVAAALAKGGFEYREVVVRINGVDTPWAADDLAALLAHPPDAVLVPKIHRPGDLARVERLMAGLGFPGGVAVWAMMETAAAILAAAEIAAAGGRLRCLAMGTNDLAADLNAQLLPGRASMLASLSICLLAARAAGIAILDGVFTDLEDDAGFAAECRQGRELGFDGKTVIHPGQISAANETFGPSPAEVAWAGRVIAHFEEARAAGAAVAVVDGKMVEELHVALARRTVALAKRIANRADK